MLSDMNFLSLPSAHPGAGPPLRANESQALHCASDKNSKSRTEDGRYCQGVGTPSAPRRLPVVTRTLASPRWPDFLEHSKLRGSWRGMQSFDCRLHPCRNRLRILHRQPRSRNRFANSHLQRLALDVVGVHRQQVECVDERDRHDIGLRLDCQKECARQERLNPSISRTAALGKDYERHAAAQTSQGLSDVADGLSLVF